MSRCLNFTPIHSREKSSATCRPKIMQYCLPPLAISVSATLCIFCKKFSSTLAKMQRAMHLTFRAKDSLSGGGEKNLTAGTRNKQRDEVEAKKLNPESLCESEKAAGWQIPLEAKNLFSAAASRRPQLSFLTRSAQRMENSHPTTLYFFPRLISPFENFPSRRLRNTKSDSPTETERVTRSAFCVFFPGKAARTQSSSPASRTVMLIIIEIKFRQHSNDLSLGNRQWNKIWPSEWQRQYLTRHLPSPAAGTENPTRAPLQPRLCFGARGNLRERWLSEWRVRLLNICLDLRMYEITRCRLQSLF